MSPPLRPGVTVAMAAHNEAAALPECLESVRSVADEVILADGESTDATREIAAAAGAQVIETTNKLMLNVNKNLAIDGASHEWVLLLDPDERVTPELAAEIRRVATRDGSHAGYWIPRHDLELGAWIPRPSPQLRLFRQDRGRFACRHIHEMVEVDGSVGTLTGVLRHEPRQSVFEYVHKRNLYSEHRARFMYEHGQRFRLHRLLLRPWYAMAKSYLRSGRRMGIAGIVIAVSAGYGTFLQDAKLWQLQREERV